jgi:hypothetical protein
MPHVHEKPTDIPPVPEGYEEARARSRSFVASDDLESERERFWEACAEPDLSEAEWDRYAAELELEAERFARQHRGLATSEPQGPADAPPATEVFLEQMLRRAAEEAQFKLRAFAEGRFRVAPFYPVPLPLREADFDDVQLVGHLSYEPMRLFVFRLERERDPELFALARQCRYLSSEMLGEGGRLTELEHAQERERIRSRAGR